MELTRTSLALICLTVLSAGVDDSSARVLAPGRVQEEAASKETPAARKERKIRHLMDLTNVREVTEKSLDPSFEAFRKMGLGDDFISGFKERFDVGQVIDWTVEIYAEHLEEETIDAMITFYESEQGKTFAKALPDIMVESLKRGQAYGEEVAIEVMQGK